MYGKAIIKPVETDTVIKDSRYDFGKYISPYHTYVDSVLEVNGRYYTKQVKPVMPNFKYVHCGVEIISLPKWIMNKVFSFADGCNVTNIIKALIRYIVDEIVEWFKQQYDQELAGDGLGNFHVGVSMDDAFIEIFGIESLPLG